MKIAVIGAGLSGLSAGIRLQQAGHEVLVLEKEAIAGGRCKAFERDGFIVDTCPELAATSYRRWLNMIEEMGLADSLVDSPAVLSMLKDGRLIDINMGNLLSVAFTPALSWSAKLAVLRGVIRLRKQIKAVPEYLIDNIDLDDPDSNAGALAERIFGKEATDYLIEPLLRPIGGVTLDMMSTLLLPYTLSDWTQMVSLKGGLRQLPLTMAAKLDVRYQCSVDKVLDQGDGILVEYVDAQGEPATLNADKCLIATPYDFAEQIYPRFLGISQGYADKMQYMTMLDIKLSYSVRANSKAAMVMIPFRENPTINVISLSHNKSPDRAPEGCSLFSIFTEHKDFANMAAKNDEEVVSIMRAEIEALYPELAGHFLWSYVSRQHRVSYVPDAGFFRRTKALWDSVGEEPRVQLAGDIFMFGGLEAAVASGERAAERMLKQSH